MKIMQSLRATVRQFILLFFIVILLPLFPISLNAAVAEAQTTKETVAQLPRAVASYNDDHLPLWDALAHRVSEEPFNLVSAVIFLMAVLHVFAAPTFHRLARRFENEHIQWLHTRPHGEQEDVSMKATVFRFLGEVEAVFGIWAIPLIISMALIKDWETVTRYVDFNVSYIEPAFVVVIMAIASTRPVVLLAESSLRQVARLGRETAAAWWLAILTLAPLLGSFITEPAAMTIAAMLLAKEFYRLNPSIKLRYATIGLLFVNVSVGGTLTHFSAPPVLMVAHTWHWDLAYMTTHFGWKSGLAILLANSLYFMAFRRELLQLGDDTAERPTRSSERRIPVWINISHILFLAWTVWTMHDPALFVGGFLFFIAFIRATAHHQEDLRLRDPLMVGFFLAGLVTHGGLQGWWVAPVLSRLEELPLFFSAMALSSFNDNASITFLASLVPSMMDSPELQRAVVAGAISGGGLTVIANAPNPAGQLLLSRFFANGVSPLWLFLAAVPPTSIVIACFLLL
jgi:hypothetical protein